MAPTLKYLQDANRRQFESGVLDLERGVTYPLGDDHFRISHGNDYFKFFDRLGDVHYIVGLAPNRTVIGAQCFIRRRIYPRQEAKRPVSVWYSCDTKVHPDHRKDGLGSQLLGAFLKPTMLLQQLRHRCCIRSYGISMNTATGDNRMRGHTKKVAKGIASSFVRTETLNLYSLNAEQMEQALPTLTAHRGPISYLSLGGIKDIVLESTGEPMPLLHVQWGKMADPKALTIPQEGHVHMFCALAGSPLAQAVENQLGLQNDGTATIYSLFLKSDFSFVLTSDI